METMRLHFNGPFSFIREENYLFESKFADDAGIYLWVIKDTEHNLNYIHYVGQTKEFGKRHREHLIHILSLNYYILDHIQARKGNLEIIWNGMWRDEGSKAAKRTLRVYEDVSRKVLDYIRIIDVYFAPTDFPNDIRRHVEGCIGWNLRSNHPEFKRFYPDDNNIVKWKKGLNERLYITSDQDTLGLDAEMDI
jgi:hypothetical protein